MRKLQLALLVVGVGALVWMIFHLGPGKLWEGMQLVGWGFALTCSAHLCGLLLDSVTLRACAGKRGQKVPYLHFARTSVAGHGVNEATPFGKVGEIVKFALLDERLPAADAGGALVAQNLASFVVNCGLIGLVAPISMVAFGVGGGTAFAFCAVSAVFLAAGGVGILILRRGLGVWPFALMRRAGIGRFRLSKERVNRWQKGWRKVEKSWRSATAQPNAMKVIWGSMILGRLANVVEAALFLYFLGGDHIIAGAFLSLASYQFSGWALSFVPMGAGSAEGSAFVMFRAVGLSPQLGVMVEIGRKLRKVVFICLGIAVLGWDTFRRMMGSEHGKVADDDHHHPDRAADDQGERST
ncbi:MAG TPA: lysylphosphatidylglycerol synthase transmembrane domain-containing protein [Kofleriaceae bacterium]|nr:lysylphosphatidylglycerol synthase transmembrane domain-containing protein [Kofleriaceae bacterium]